MPQFLAILILSGPPAAYFGAGRVLRRIAPGGRVIMLPGRLYQIARRSR